MAVSRLAASRGLAGARLVRPVPALVTRRTLQPAARRYASGESHGSSSSDLPWLIGSVAVTVPSVYFLWPSGSHGDAHHGDSHAAEGGHEEAEGQEAEDKTTDASQEEDSAPQQEEEDESKSDEGSKQASGGSEDSKDDSEKSSGDAVKSSNQKVDGVQFKGKTGAGDDNKEMTDTRKREPDSKGAFKKRIDSEYRKELGAGDHQDEDGSPSGKTNTGPSGKAGAIDTKQAGLSTTPTRHSTQIDQDPEKSKKGEGVPDTAKSQTTIDPKRPQK